MPIHVHHTASEDSALPPEADAQIGRLGNLGHHSAAVDRPRPVPAVLVGVVLAIALMRFGLVVAYQLPAHHDLAYESPNLATIQQIQAGGNIYGPETYAHSPFVLTIYTPLYHYLVSLFPTDGPNPFVYGRLLTLACLLLSAAAVFAIRPLEPGLAVVAVSLFLLVGTVASNAAFLKNDTLALCCSVWAVVLATRPASSRRIYAVAGLCVLAFAAKQSYLSASLASLILLRRDWRFPITWGVLLAGFLGVASWMWGQGFWFSVFTAPQNPLSAERWTHVWGMVLRDPAFLVLLACAGVQLLRSPAHPFAIYAAISWLVLLGTVGKAGSSANYFIEPMLATVAWMVSANDRRILPVGALAAAALVAVLPLPTFTTPDRSRRIVEQQADLRDTLLEAGIDPTAVLNLDAAPLGFAAGAPFQVNDPLLYGLVYAQGRMSSQPLVSAIESGRFDAVVWPAADSLWVTSPKLVGVRAAIERRYPGILTVHGHIYRTP